MCSSFEACVRTPRVRVGSGWFGEDFREEGAHCATATCHTCARSPSRDSPQDPPPPLISRAEFTSLSQSPVLKNALQKRSNYARLTVICCLLLGADAVPCCCVFVFVRQQRRPSSKYETGLRSFSFFFFSSPFSSSFSLLRGFGRLRG